MQVSFEKWHGAGNDFIIIDNWDLCRTITPEQVQHLCDRHFGIGADAVILFEPSDKAECKMNYINADGTPAETCGNGVRCTAAFGLLHHLQGDTVRIENPGGEVETAIVIGRAPWQIRVEQGSPRTAGVPDFPDDHLGKPLEIDGTALEVWCVSMGNPHAVQFVDAVADAPVLTQGRAIEHHELFPNRINAEYVEVLSPTEANFRVWERGCGETLACGSGAAAATVAGVLAGKFQADTDITMHLPGGDLIMRWDRVTDRVYKTGPAQMVYSGEIKL